MSDSGGDTPDQPVRARRVRTREPTLIGMVAAKPTPIEPPSIEPQSIEPQSIEPATLEPATVEPASAPAAPPPPAAKKAFPAPSSGVVPKAPPAFTARGLPPRKPFPRRPPEPPPKAKPEPEPAAVEPELASPSEPPPEDLGGEPTQAAAERPGARTLMDDWSSAEIPDVGEEDDDVSAAPLAGESTQVTDEPEAIHTDPGLEIPFEGELASEPTMPAASALEPESRVTDPLPPGAPVGVRPEPVVHDDLVPVSTVIVDPASLKQPAQVYTMDMDSGRIAMQTGDEEAYVVPGTKSSMGLWIGLAIGGVLVVAVGVGLGYAFMSGGSGDSIVATESGADPEPAVEPTQAVADPAEPVVREPSEPNAPPNAQPNAEPDGTEPIAEDGEEGEEGEEDADDEPVAPVAAGTVSIADVEAYELELPRLSRRARRMTQAQRRQQSGRLRARAFAAYRAERWEDAATSYAEALTINDWDVASVEGMARTRARQERFPEAVAWAELAVQRNARSAATFRILGDVWRQAGHPDRAREAWRRGLRRHPDDRWLRQRIRDLE
ncbi:MAG: hypothetical protein H6719_11880 [Sandaracinaceae bacterium]|nr:hypothetical protein [Sandaracinaceae bacterium]